MWSVHAHVTRLDTVEVANNDNFWDMSQSRLQSSPGFELMYKLVSA